MMDITKIQFFWHTTFNKTQKEVLFPSINKVYKDYRSNIIPDIKFQNEMHLVRDARCDSPGYNAKYGTYTLMSSLNNKIIDFYVVHVSVAGNSARIEKYGLVTLFENFVSKNINIVSLTADRHVQIKSCMKISQPNILHQFDVWHVIKNIKKKLVKSASKKDCEELNAWIKASVNHILCLCASFEGNVVILKEKWQSILYHIRNIHHWEHFTVYKKCEHPKLSK